MNPQCEYVKDMPHLVEDLIDREYLDEPLKYRKKVRWSCYSCNTIWSESIALRKRYNYCPSCENRRPANKCLICTKEPQFNYSCYSWGTFCGEHKLDDMVNVRSDKCIKTGCPKHPIFGVVGTKKALFCKEHKKIDMVDVKSKKCLEKGCPKHPSYNLPGLTKAYCKDHKSDDMVDVAHRKCLEEDCPLIPSYNFSYSLTPLYCSGHKLDDMIDVYHKRCKEKGCAIIPCFNIVGSKSGLYCSNHKKDDMVDVITKTCCIEGCDRQAKFNIPGSTIRLYCDQDKKSGMIDVSARICVENSCENKSYYNIPGRIAEYCSTHKKRGMIRYPTKQCEHCKELASYGNNKPLHCKKHSLLDEVNLLEKKCKGCNLEFILNIDTNLCEYCDPFQSKKYRHVKELEVKDSLDANNIVYESHDKVIEKGVCGKERPDFLFDCGTHFVIVEVDENRHSHVTPECERVRMINISQSLGLPTIFIRYNPDSYRIKGEKKRTSGISRRLRQVVLRDWILYCQTNPPIDYLEVAYLYYDDWDGTEELTPIPF